MLFNSINKKTELYETKSRDNGPKTRLLLRVRRYALVANRVYVTTKRLTVLALRAPIISRTLAFLVADAVAAVQAGRVTDRFAIRHGGPLDFSRRPFAVLTEHVGHGRRVRELVSVHAADRTSAEKTYDGLFLKPTLGPVWGFGGRACDVMTSRRVAVPSDSLGTAFLFRVHRRHGKSAAAPRRRAGGERLAQRALVVLGAAAPVGFFARPAVLAGRITGG